MDYKEFFTVDNKSGIKSKESYLSLNYPDLYKEIKDFILLNKLDGLTFKEEIYYFINNKTNKHICLNCGSDVKFKGTINKGYSDYCSLSCANDSGDLVNRQKESVKIKYGVDSTNKLEFVKDKKKETSIKKYGVDNVMKNESIKMKQLNTIKNRYGVDNIMKNESIKDIHKDSIKNVYGVDNVFKSEDIKNKIKQTNLINLGVEYPMQSDVIKDKIKDISKNKLLIKFPFIKEINDNILTCHCDICNNDYEISRILLNERNREGYGLCTVCNEIGINNTSKLEKDVALYIKSLISDEVKENDRKLLGNLELDIYVESRNIAFEINGLYWHSELFKNNSYHLNKTELCEEKGIKLIQIFEDEWIYKQDIVKSRIKNLFGLNEIKIYARKCEVKEVNVKDNKEFLNNNHIQGECKSSVKLGLYYNNELVSLMTFDKGRVIMGGKSDEWELVRFCNKLNTNVIGGASKILKHFIKQYNPKVIISYADRRWSQGDMYSTLGFDFIHNSSPNYWYINGDIREYRFKYRKNNLKSLSNYSEELSEHEIMLLNKKYRIYDCGSKKYMLTF